MNQQTWLVVILLLLSLSSFKPTGAQINYRRYCNSRFGFCVDYLKTFRIDPPPANGDGRRFTHGNLEMIVSGRFNVFQQNLDSVRRESIFCANGIRPIVTYQFVGKNFFVVSGFCGNQIFYRKVYVGRENINSLYFQYPKHDKNLYDSLVTHIANSFQAGELE
ncbi:MAG: hypothetical protein ACK4QL_01505 [Pseudanabaenaceae cyanobacterium]